jgi:hypothetical protein
LPLSGTCKAIIAKRHDVSLRQENIMKASYVQWLAPLRLSPKTPAIMNAMLISLNAVAGSRKYRIPIVAIRAVPTPDQTAYATLTSILRSANVNATNEAT